MLKRGEAYLELGSDCFYQHKEDTGIKSAIKRLESLGLKVTMEVAA
ncbi:MAG TPA: hypothetical protein VLH18_00950 [Candidatus Limnocylindrales bacterium]|nr:hypothetical protein [Candidatus Limnocylindrales bacterium]